VQVIAQVTFCRRQHAFSFLEALGTIRFAGLRQGVDRCLEPVILSVLPLAYRDRVVKSDCASVRIAAAVKEDAEAIQAVILRAPKHERLKEISESIVARFYLDGPDSVAPLMAMVTTMLGVV